MEINSGLLTSEQIWQEVEEIAALFTRRGAKDLAVSYGFGCDLEMDDLYQKIMVKPEALLSFLSQSMAIGIYDLGADDFFIESRVLGFQFLLCHEGDVHLETENAGVAEYIKARWVAKEYSGYEKLGDVWVPLWDGRKQE